MYFWRVLFLPKIINFKPAENWPFLESEKKTFWFGLRANFAMSQAQTSKSWFFAYFCHSVSKFWPKLRRKDKFRGNPIMFPNENSTQFGYRRSYDARAVTIRIVGLWPPFRGLEYVSSEPRTGKPRGHDVRKAIIRASMIGSLPCVPGFEFLK